MAIFFYCCVHCFIVHITQHTTKFAVAVFGSFKTFASQPYAPFFVIYGKIILTVFVFKQGSIIEVVGNRFIFIVAARLIVVYNMFVVGYDRF